MDQPDTTIKIALRRLMDLGFDRPTAVKALYHCAELIQWSFQYAKHIN